MRFVLLAVSGIALSGCGSTSHIDSQNAGKTTAYAPGVPNFDMELVPTQRQGKAGINIHIGIPYRSLIFIRQGDAYGAEYEIAMQIYGGEGEYIIQSTEWLDSLEVSTYERTRGYDLFSIDKRINLAPGEYVFRVVLRDQNSDKQTARLKRISIPSYGEGEPLLGHLYVEQIETGTSQPVVSLHVPSHLDSVRVATELYNAQSFGEIDVNLNVIRFHTDGEVASPPYWLTPYAGSLQYQGVDYDEADTISTSRYTLENLSQRAQLGFMLPALDRGIYRVNITAHLRKERSSSDSLILKKSRDLSIKGSDFPTIAELDEVIDALVYITDKGELSHIQDAQNPEEKRRRFDAFWGELTGNRKEAARLLRTYYTRVEEANLFFTSHKEGWKTDRGMVYVVMGPPLYVQHYFDTEIWHYSYSQDPREQFVFERVRPYYRAQGVRFNNYLLQRRPYYQRTWERAIREWRKGRVL